MSPYENMSLNEKKKLMVLFYFYSEWVVESQEEILPSRLLILLGRGNCLANGVLEGNLSQREEALPSLMG